MKTTNETLFLELQDLKKTVENIERLLLKLQLQMWGWGAPKTNNSNKTEIK